MVTKPTLAAAIGSLVLILSVTFYLAFMGGGPTGNVSTQTSPFTSVSSSTSVSTSISPSTSTNTQTTNSASTSETTQTSSITTLTSTTATQGPLAKMSVATAFPSLSLDRMVFLSEPEDGTNRLFVALQAGTVVVFPNSGDIGSSQVFLDISGRVTSGGNEQGLLGLAFDPNYKTNGYLFVYYTSASPSRHAVLSRFSVSPSNSSTADPNSELIILQIPQPRGYTNHNGGSVLFGPDGYLYIGIGDGGSEGDPQGNGQNLSTLLGKIIRIDVNDSSKAEPYRIPSDNPFVDNANTRGEIWAYGLRNPWRLSFDQQTGLLWAGDVGQNSFEEVDTIKSGGNYGWNRMEGFHCYPPSLSQCDMSGLELPVTEYDHGQGCAITGGYVYRGSRLPSLYGAYVYADYCSGKIWALRIVGGKVTDHIELVDGPTQISSFGEDVNRELYILSFDGSIYQLEPAV